MSCGSDRPSVDVSRAPGTAKAVVLKDGGTGADEDWPLVVGGSAGLFCSFVFWGLWLTAAVASFEMTFIRLKAVSYGLLLSIDDVLLINVIHCFAITVIVEINFDQCLWVLTKPLKHCKNDSFLLQSRSFHLQNGNENLMHKHFNFLLLSGKKMCGQQLQE